MILNVRRTREKKPSPRWDWKPRPSVIILVQKCTSAKLFKLGLPLNDKCTFCDSSKEEWYHIFFECPMDAKVFWKTFSSWWFELVDENITVTLKDIILGRLNRTDFINYLINLGKLCIWECKKAGIYPDFNIFLKKNTK